MQAKLVQVKICTSSSVKLFASEILSTYYPRNGLYLKIRISKILTSQGFPVYSGSMFCNAATVALDSNPVKITPIWREDTIPILPNWLLVFHGHERANSQSLLMRCCFYFFSMSNPSDCPNNLQRTH